MTTQSAVDFPGQHRIHIALKVSNLQQSREFYELLLGVAPSKERIGYIKFEPADPSVNLTLNETDSPTEVASISHFGIQVKSIAAVHEAIERFQSAGIPTTTEEQTTCCYAVQDKVWATDPDGNQWEVFVVLQADVNDELYQENGCCAPEVVTLDAPQSTDGKK